MREIRLSRPALKLQLKPEESLMKGSLMIATSAVILLVGMLARIAMGIQQNFVLARRKRISI
jgi:hypothetical protein